jgi:PD-(D/E)XK nuclease superfamily
METKPLKTLSASRIKTLETCSWVYWNNYHTKVPQSQNDGALRGTICHTVFELLLNKRHLKNYKRIIKKNAINGDEGVDRLVKKLSAKVKLDESNYKLLNDMILVGLKSDFFGEGGEIVKPEYDFDIINEEPKYHIKGFIDKPIKIKKEMHIIDYKSSKYKFRGDDLEANIQAMMYSLASKKLWPKLKPIVKFLFLRFPKQPIQELSFDDNEIKGFEHYLEHINKYVDNFDENSAQANFAIDNVKNKWMCQVGGWKCPYKDPYEYYVKLNDKNEVAESSLDGKFKNIEGFKIEKRTYEGCPRFNNKKDDFLEDNTIKGKDDFLG